ncbi:DISARM system phospholipase D-like protein DrmC [Streptomyces xiaopingdaonensis]|uniref:DISARM system phospholipase D-like protein DrmC n=1 Tax=Streptomyces xiaopingdaonensis TaxID=1565415 RepID=UPI0002F678DE|nr:DISARM system phospholipase D-like protein DrmC [Streptomyces xiaopingdaonensis]
MSRRRFEKAAADVATVLGPRRTKSLAGMLASGRSASYILHATHHAAVSEPLRRLLAEAEAGGVGSAEIAAYLRGFVAGKSGRAEETEVRTVWSGPRTANVPVRATAQVLIDLIHGASDELLAMTYSARAYAKLTAALRDAVARGVRIDVGVETTAGADGLLSGPEPAAAFAAVPEVRLWYWPQEVRARRGARLHAKVVVADGRSLFLGSANLTASAAARNLEAGALIVGGTAPRRAAEHIRELQRTGVLRRLSDT